MSKPSLRNNGSWSPEVRFSSGGSEEEPSLFQSDDGTIWVVYAANRFGNLDWSVDVEGTTVTVRLTSTTKLPFRPPGFPGSADVASESAAIVPIR